MSTPGRRRSVSMRDYEYVALDMYKCELAKHNPGHAYSITGVLGSIMQGEIPPIPKKYLDAGRVRAKLERDERAKNPKPKNTSEIAAEDMRPGGGIFSF